jgi:hypothetical protein
MLISRFSICLSFFWSFLTSPIWNPYSTSTNNCSRWVCLQCFTRLVGHATFTLKCFYRVSLVCCPFSVQSIVSIDVSHRWWQQWWIARVSVFEGIHLSKDLRKFANLHHIMSSCFSREVIYVDQWSCAVWLQCSRSQTSTGALLTSSLVSRTVTDIALDYSDTRWNGEELNSQKSKYQGSVSFLLHVLPHFDHRSLFPYSDWFDKI